LGPLFTSATRKAGQLPDRRGPAERATRTAQAAYRAALRDVVAPALRESGFQGSGRAYRLDDERCWVRLGFQSSMRNTAECVTFTVNLAVVNKEAWARARIERPHLPEVPLPNIGYGEPTWQQRLGFLMPSAFDRWWVITNHRNAPKVAGKAVAAIREYGLPELLRRRTLGG
jgi:hypothetical protein